MSDLAIVQQSRLWAPRVAIVAGGRRFTYAELGDASARAASHLLDGSDDLREARVGFLVPPGFAYAAVQWGTWRAGGIAVPLSASQAPAEWEYVMADSRAAIIVADPAFRAALGPLAERHDCRFLLTDDVLQTAPGPLPSIQRDRRAMILYTSGTTSQPKGVVTTHANLEAHVTTLVDAWGWTARDRVLLVLPLHHVHGIINVLTCALWAGAVCEVSPRFEVDEVWQRLASGTLTLFMAVPTIYTRLIAAWDRADDARREAMSAGCRRMRLMVSGSAALPVSVLQRWQQISGHVLLERYGMTEIGMALSNPLHGDRRPGFVGTPLAGVEVRLVDDRGRPVAPGIPGEIEVRGPGVFLEYWGSPGQTREAFRDGWFRTGDVAVIEEGSYRILGRRSIDIIKTGGHKVSALEIEEVLRAHPCISECAVVGVADPEWGERVAAAVVLRPGCTLTLEALRDWARSSLASSKIPTRLMVCNELPRNAIGKVTKPKVRELLDHAPGGLASGPPTETR
jgi:malonyl-CoA/methylmalonyl-CoA synthetase